MQTYFVVVNHAEHSGRVMTDDPTRPDFRYQDLTAPHGQILCETTDRAEADRELAEYLECDSVQQGTYCYTHNPLAS